MARPVPPAGIWPKSNVVDEGSATAAPRGRKGWLASVGMQGVPHYDDGAAVIGSLVFLVLLGIIAVAALRKRRR